MTDRECLEQILNSLGVVKVSIDDCDDLPDENQYYIEERKDSIKYCLGTGFGSFVIEFVFNNKGRCIKYAVYE